MQDRKQKKALTNSQSAQIDFELSDEDLLKISGANIVWGGVGNEPPPPKYGETNVIPLENDG
jgi:hypothetical protein